MPNLRTIRLPFSEWDEELQFSTVEGYRNNRLNSLIRIRTNIPKEEAALKRVIAKMSEEELDQLEKLLAEKGL